MSSALITNVDRKMLQKTKFPPEFDRKVDMEKVNVPVIKKWVADEIARLLNDDDDVLTDTISNVLEESRFVSCRSSRLEWIARRILTALQPKIKELQIYITGFLNASAAPFAKSLWKLLLSAQNGAQGVPQELLEAKKAELEQERVSTRLSIVGEKCSG
jgi:serine/arginine repetitive matrix protein 1